MSLAEVRAAARVVATAQGHLYNAVRAAADSPTADISAIAREAHISRPTVYRWLSKNARPARGRGELEVDVREVLDEALIVLAMLGQERLAGEGLRTDIVAAKAQRLMLGVKNLPPDPFTPANVERRGEDFEAFSLGASLAGWLADHPEQAENRRVALPR